MFDSTPAGSRVGHLARRRRKYDLWLLGRSSLRSSLLPVVDAYVSSRVFTRASNTLILLCDRKSEAEERKTVVKVFKTTDKNVARGSFPYSAEVCALVVMVR